MLNYKQKWQEFTERSKIMNNNKTKIQNFIVINLIAIFVLLFAFEVKAEGWRFWKKKEETCESMTNEMIKSRLIGWKVENFDHIKHGCYQIILKTGDHKELYAYYRAYKYIDDVNKGAGANNIYHYMLFYANQNSREFDPKTKSFKREKGLYEQDLKDFENAMTQEEKIKAFSYIADNLATGKEGWVKVNDYKKSFEYLKKAAEAGDNFSQSELGTCYFYGADRFSKFSFLKDYVEAYKWTYLSTKHSLTNSYEYKIILKNLKTIESNMTKSQIDEANKRINLWLEQNRKFIQNNPLKITKMSNEEIKKAKEESQKIIKKYNMFPSNINNQPNQ